MFDGHQAVNFRDTQKCHILFRGRGFGSENHGGKDTACDCH